MTALAAGCQEQALRTFDRELLKRVMSELYTRAQRTDPSYAPARLEAGLLFCEKYQYKQAEAEFEAALKADPKDARALYGIALAAWGREDFAKAQEACGKALQENPSLEEALLLLAALAIWDEDESLALKNTAAVLRINPESAEALAIEAAVAFVAGRQEEGSARLARAEALCPQWPEAYRIVAGAMESRHRSRDAVAWLERGLRAAPDDPGLMTDLGHIHLHSAREAEGRALLEKVYKKDPFNSRVSNTLNLMDELQGWPVIRTRHFRIRCHPSEADLIGGLLAESLERDYAEITALYAFEPPEQPVDVELYPNQSDFAVRTVGQPQFGALGVCFGRFMAVDSPAVRAEMEPFHWADVARHEFTHVVTLQLSDMHVPRWLTEGLSVYAERYGRFSHDQMMVNAAAEGKFMRLADINRSFTHPEYPWQVQLAYSQGGEMARFIAETYGFEVIRRMLKGYKQGKDTPQVVRETLNMSLEEFDRAFGKDLSALVKTIQLFPMIGDEEVKKLEAAKPQNPADQLALARQYLVRGYWSSAERWARKARRAEDREVAGEAAALLGFSLRRQGGEAEAETFFKEAVVKRPEHYLGHLGLALHLKGRGDWEAAIAECRAARRCYPNAVEGENSPYLIEADCCFSSGKVEEGIQVLKLLCGRNRSDMPPRLKLAGALKDQGRPEEALGVLDTALLAEVYDLGVHRMRAEILKALKRPSEAAKALGLGSHAAPKDAAAATEAAEAWVEAGDPAEAKRFWSRAKALKPEDPRVKALGEKLGGPPP